MAIITISRGTFAGGEKLAELLAKRLSYRSVSRELLYTKLEEDYGFTTQEAAEIMEQAPSHLEFAVAKHDRKALGLRRRQLFFSLQASLCQLLGEDGVVYHGQSGHMLLPGVAHVLRVRLIAPRHVRVDLAMQREKLSKFEAAQKVDRVDSERARWTKAFFTADWSDPALYDMVFNLEGMTLDEMADVIAHTAKLPSFVPTAESKQAMRNLCLSSRVLAQLVRQPETATLEVEIVVDEGTIRVLGHLAAADLKAAVGVVEGVEGVKQVKTT